MGVIIKSSTLYSVNDLKDSTFQKHLEAFLTNETIAITGYQTNISSLPELNNINICFMSLERIIYIFIPENLYFTTDDLIKRIKDTYEKKSLPNLNRLYVNDIDSKREIYNNKF